MCEIALIDPETVTAESFHQLAHQMYVEQGDGLGVVAINTDGERFEYDAWRNAYPDWFQLHQFYERTNEDAWRYVIHSRAKTAGSVSTQNTHPLPVDCPECDAKYVVHNGSVRNHQQTRASLISHGHDFQTGVDSEVIAHKVGDLPETIENHDRNTYSMTGNLNYFVFFEDGILVKLTSKYYINDEDFTVACRTRYSKDPINGTIQDEEWSNNARWLLISPDKEIERKDSAATRNRTRSTGYGGSKYTGQDSTAKTSTNRSSTDDSIVVETYEDLMPDIEEVTAIKVAPGVVRVIDEEADDSEFIFRRDDPAMYFYYAGGRDHVDERMLQLHDLFDEDGNLREAGDVMNDDITPEQVLTLLNQDPSDAAAEHESIQATLDAAPGGDGEGDFR